jgi:hypothetical protein
MSVSSFATNNVKTESNDYVPQLYAYLTSCGVIATSYSYEPVTASQYADWAGAMEEYYCSEL